MFWGLYSVPSVPNGTLWTLYKLTSVNVMTYIRQRSHPPATGARKYGLTGEARRASTCKLQPSIQQRTGHRWLLVLFPGFRRSRHRHLTGAGGAGEVRAPAESHECRGINLDPLGAVWTGGFHGVVQRLGVGAASFPGAGAGLATGAAAAKFCVSSQRVPVPVHAPHPRRV
jgi:hypothetical protein